MKIITIYYRISDLKTIRKIQERFGFPKAMTVNGTWPVMVADRDWELLQDVERRRYVSIRHNVNLKRMKPTKLFIGMIEDFLTKEAEASPEFAKKMQDSPEKTPEVVCNYIIAELSESNQNDCDDEKIYDMARKFIHENKFE